MKYYYRQDKRPSATSGLVSVKNLQSVSVDEFKRLLVSGLIRPACLEDVYQTHHNRALYQHPNTGQFYVLKKGD